MSETPLPTTAEHSPSGMSGGWNTSCAAGNGTDTVNLALDNPSYGIYAQGTYNWLQGNLTVGAESVQPDIAPTGHALDVSGNAAIGGTLTTTGALTANGGLTVNGGTTTDTLNAAGNATIGGTLTTTGALTANGGLTVNGGTTTDTLNAAGNATIGGTLTTTGALTANGGLTVTGGTTTDTLNAAGNATIGGLVGLQSDYAVYDSSTQSLTTNSGSTVERLNVPGFYQITWANAFAATPTFVCNAVYPSPSVHTAIITIRDIQPDSATIQIVDMNNNNTDCSFTFVACTF